MAVGLLIGATVCIHTEGTWSAEVLGADCASVIENLKVRLSCLS